MKEHNDSLFAKLLAEENLTVVEANVSTASFNVRDRVLTLPIWNAVSKHVSYLLKAHEVGHALYTPEDGWHEAACSDGPIFKGYLNVVEDARIEKLVQRKYPGLRRSFVQGHKELFNSGFFGANTKNMNERNLIDRINIFFKCGSTVGIKFSADEKVWIDRIAKLETWEEVVEISKELFAFAKEQKQQEQESAQEDDYSDENGEKSSYFDDIEESDEDGEESVEDGEVSEDGEESVEDGEVSEDGEESDEFDDLFKNEEGGTEWSLDDLKSETDESLRESIERELNTTFDGVVFNCNVPKSTVKDVSRFVISNKDILNGLNENAGWGKEHWASEKWSAEVRQKHALTEYKNFVTKTRRFCDIMVSEFLSKKSAAEFARTSVSKTGVIDTLKMNDYLFDDDIFKRIAVVPEGQSHGLIMLLDMSGSMYDILMGVIEKTLLLVNFCKRVGIPFRVYSFTNGDARDTKRGLNLFDMDHLEIRELFREGMSNKEIAMIGGHMILAAKAYQYTRRSRVAAVDADIYSWSSMNEWGGQAWAAGEGSPFRMSGTPLDEAIIAMIPLALEFKDSNRIDILNTVFLTDGYAAEKRVLSDCIDSNRYHLAKVKSDKRTMTSIVCEYNNKTYKLGKNNYLYNRSTSQLLSAYRDVTGSRNIGYFVVTHRKGEVKRTIASYEGAYPSDARLEADWKVLRELGHAKVDAVGYDDMFLLTTKSIVGKEQEDLSEMRGATKAKLKRAFKSIGKGSKMKRKLLVEIIDKVA